MNRISYSNTGKILIDDNGLQKELESVLNLNDEYLVSNRRKVLLAYQHGLTRKYKGKLNKEFWQKEHSRLSAKKDGQYSSYVGILLWYTNKKY